MKTIITALNNPEINKDIKKEKEIEIFCKDIQYKEGILEILEKQNKIDYIILDEKLPGEIEIEDLLEKILEKNEKIKIILLIKKDSKKIENKFNKNIITIYYEYKINYNLLKNYKNNLEKIDKKEQLNIENNLNNKKIKNIENIKRLLKKEKNKKRQSKIITVLGERKSGKTITIINILKYLENNNFKILIIELNEENSNIYSFFKNSKFNKKIIKNKTKNKIKNKYKKIKGIFKQKYLNKKIIEKMIKKINKNVNIISYNKLLDFNIIKNIQKNYDYVFIEFYSKKFKLKNNKIIINSDEKLLLIKPNFLEIKSAKKIIEKNKLNNFKIIINNYNNFSIDENLLKNIFYKNKIIGKIKYIKEYENLINNNLKNYFINKKDYKKQIKKIIKNII